MSSPSVLHASVEELLAICAGFCAPFQAFDEAFLETVARTDAGGAVLIGGVTLTGTNAALVLRFRAVAATIRAAPE